MAQYCKTKIFIPAAGSDTTYTRTARNPELFPGTDSKRRKGGKQQKDVPP